MSSPYRNRLLRRFDQSDIDKLTPHMTRMAMPLRMNLESVGEPRTQVYFIENGIASTVAKGSDGREIEVGMVGFEGMVGSSLILGNGQPALESYVQMEGEAIRIPAAEFENLLAEHLELRLFLLRYIQSLYMQTAYTALVNGRSKLEERLGRWLLMCDDRVDGEKFHITHEFIAVMLGVRRPGVTIALQELEGKGLIRSNRGEVVIRDREGLIALSNGGYGPPEAEYERLVGSQK